MGGTVRAAGTQRLIERRGLEAAWCLPQEATLTAFGLAETRSSISTGEAPSLGFNAVPVGWTRAVWTLHCTATVMLTSRSGEDGGGGSAFGDAGAAVRQGGVTDSVPTGEQTRGS